MRTSKKGMRKIVFTKKYHPDGSFDEYMSRILFRGYRWYDLYNNKTCACIVMSDSVRTMLSFDATEDMELGCLDAMMALLCGAILDDYYIIASRIIIRGYRWYDLYNNKTYACTVMSDSVRTMLSFAATEHMGL